MSAALTGQMNLARHTAPGARSSPPITGIQPASATTGKVDTARLVTLAILVRMQRMPTCRTGRNREECSCTRRLSVRGRGRSDCGRHIGVESPDLRLNCGTTRSGLVNVARRTGKIILSVVPGHPTTRAHGGGSLGMTTAAKSCATWHCSVAGSAAWTASTTISCARSPVLKGRSRCTTHA